MQNGIPEIWKGLFYNGFLTSRGRIFWLIGVTPFGMIRGINIELYRDKCVGEVCE